MNDRIDSVVWRAFTDSAVVRAVERPAAAVRNAAASSAVMSQARSWWPTWRAHAGELACSAAVTNVALILAASHPAGWQWLIIPSFTFALGAVLIAFRRSAN